MEPNTIIEAISGMASDFPEKVKDMNSFGKFIAGLWDLVSPYLASAGVRLVAAIAILIIGLKLVKLLTRRIGASKRLEESSPTAKSFLRSSVSVALKAIIVITCVAVMGVPMTSVAAVVASAGLAIGMAVEGSLANIASGFILVASKPFSVGDYISSGSLEGTVTDMGIFYTTLAAYDGTTVILPNSSVTGGSVVNYSARKTRRITLSFPVAYGSDIDKVKSVLTETARADSRVLADPAPAAMLEAHGDSSLDFILRVWCAFDDYWDVSYALTEAVSKALVSNGVEIPFPQMDVHIKEPRQ